MIKSGWPSPLTSASAETGYADSGERYYCRDCGGAGDVDDTVPALVMLPQPIRGSPRTIIARRRYLGGLASYYEVLEAQQLLYPAEIGLSETSRDRRLAIVQLYRALGGGWKFDNTQWTNGR
jgi:hypothetical protein